MADHKNITLAEAVFKARMTGILVNRDTALKLMAFVSEFEKDKTFSFTVTGDKIKITECKQWP